MKRLFTFFIILFFTQGYGQDLEMDAELIELNHHYSSNPTNFSLFQNKLYFNAIHKGIDNYSIFNYDGDDIEMMKNSEGEGILSGPPIKGDNVLYFFGKTENDSEYTNYLWVSNGEENSAIPLLELDGFAELLFTIGNRLFFLYSGPYGKYLWTSNGTVESTIELKELHWTAQNGSYVKDLIEYQGKLFFLTDDPAYGEELWVSDGTVNGTHMVKDIGEGSQSSGISSLFIFNEKIYFVANDGVKGYELWTSDGTNSGTYILKDINAGSNNAVNPFDNQFIEFDGSFYFFANDGTNVQLWKSDGTTSGTNKFKDVNTFQYNNSSQTASINGEAANDYLVFKAYSYNSSNQQYTEKLWKSDGTSEGTLEFLELNSNYAPFSDSQFYRVQNKIYFTQESTYPNQKLWVTDGTTIGSMSVVDGYSEYSGFKKADNAVFLKAKINHSESQILKIDYLTNDYSIFLDNVINPERGFGFYNDEIYFGFDYNYFDNYHPSGSELWKSDLGGNNPVLVKDINVSAPSYPVNFSKINNKSIFYSGNYGQSDVGLYITDGTFNGTQFLKDMYIENNQGEIYTTFFKIGNDYFFRGGVLENYPYSSRHLYKTNGTIEGTVLVSDQVKVADSNYRREIYEEMNGKLYFLGEDGGYHYSFQDLWVSDGTSGGTYKVYDFQNEGDNGTMITSMKNFSGYLYFTAKFINESGPNGRQVWRTNGTTQGTEMIFEAPYEYWQSSQPPHILGEIEGKLIFVNVNAHHNQYLELYSIDQNNGEPQMFFSMDALPHQGGNYGTITPFKYQDKLVMPIMLPIGVNELKMSFLKTDGTTDGTVVLNPIDSFGVYNSVICGNYLYFTDYWNTSLWRTNVENNGTLNLIDVQLGYEKVSNLTCHKDNLYFSYLNYHEIGEGNYEYEGVLNVTNGNPNEIHSIQLNRIDNDPISEITNIHSDGNLLYMTMTERTHGNELYVANPDFVLSTEEINEGLTKDNSKVLIYPNPTSSEINVVSNDQSKIKQIQLYDLTGKLMEIGLYNSNEVKINLEKYNSGIYLLKVQTEKNTTTKKVIVRKK